MINFQKLPCENFHKTKKNTLSKISAKATFITLTNNSNANDSNDSEAVEELSSFFPPLISIPNPIYTIAAPPTYRETIIGQKSVSLEEPLLIAASVVACNLIIYSILAINNKIQTGRFFLKKHLSQIDILLGYKKKEFKLSQAIALLKNIHKMPTEKAACFLLDTFPEFENDCENDCENEYENDPISHDNF